MKNELDIVRTPNGACLGVRIMIDGKTGVRYKAGKKVEDLLPEQVVECIAGVPVDHIVYKNEVVKDKDEKEDLDSLG